MHFIIVLTIFFVSGFFGGKINKPFCLENASDLTHEFLYYIITINTCNFFFNFSVLVFDAYNNKQIKRIITIFYKELLIANKVIS